MKILNFGSCNIDLVYSVERIVAVGETVAAAKVETFPGGKGLNQSVALARAGADVSHAGCIGGDGEFLRELMRASGVDAAHLRTVGERTGHAMIQVDADGRNSIVIYHGANFAVTRGQVDEALAGFGEGDLLLLQNEICELDYIIEKATERGVAVALNPSPFDDAMRRFDLDRVSWLVVNEVEAAGYLQSERFELDAFVGAMRAAHPSLRVIVTLGESGSVYFDAERRIAQPAFRVEAADTTAAGDTFTGYFFAGIARGLAVGEALRLASAAAAIAVSRMGAASSIPTLDEVERLLPSLDTYN